MYLVSVFVDRNLYVIATVDPSWIYLTVAFPLLIKYFMIFEKKYFISPPFPIFEVYVLVEFLITPRMENHSTSGQPVPVLQW